MTGDHRRLRIVYVTPGFVINRDDPGLPGVVDLIERVANVHDCHVVALRHPPHRATDRVAGATVDALGLAAARGALGRARVQAAGLRAVLRARHNAQIDLVHGLWADEAGAVAAIAGRLLGRPSIVSVLGGELVGLPDIRYGARLGRGGRWTAAVALRGADLVTAGSRLALDALVARRSRRPVELLPLGVDLDQFRPAEHPPEPPTILFVGSLEPVKDPAMAVSTFAELAATRPTLRLMIAGDGSLRGALEALVAARALTDRTRFLGHVPRRELAEVYRAATVLAVTSRHEGQSLAAVEAAASGVPVIGAAVGILPELGYGATIVPFGDGPALTRALAAVLDDPAVAARMATAARLAAARFEIGRTTEAVLDAYARLAGRGSG